MLGGDDLGQLRRSLGGELPEGEQQLRSLSESDECRQVANALVAAATASSTSGADAKATCFVTCPVEGL